LTIVGANQQKDTERKVMETMKSAATKVAGSVWQLWEITTNPSREKGSEGQDNLKEAGKVMMQETTEALDCTYEKTLEKAVDKMLQALDVSLQRAKTKGFQAGLMITSGVTVMGAQLQLTYTTKETDSTTATGPKGNKKVTSKQKGSDPTPGRKSNQKKGPPKEESTEP